MWVQSLGLEGILAIVTGNLAPVDRLQEPISMLRNPDATPVSLLPACVGLTEFDPFPLSRHREIR